MGHIELPRYQSHKQVWALQIERVEVPADTGGPVTLDNLFCMDSVLGRFAVVHHEQLVELKGLTAEHIEVVC